MKNPGKEGCNSVPRAVGLIASGAVFVFWAWNVGGSARAPGFRGMFWDLPLTTPLLLWVVSASLPGLARGGALGVRRAYLIAFGCGAAAVASRFAFSMANPVGGGIFVWDSVFAVQWSLLVAGVFCVLCGVVLAAGSGRAASGTPVGGSGLRAAGFAGLCRRMVRVLSVAAVLVWWVVSLAIFTVEAMRWIPRWRAVDAAAASLFLASGFLMLATAGLLPGMGGDVRASGRTWRFFAVVAGLASLASFWDLRWTASPFARVAVAGHSPLTVILGTMGLLAVLLGGWASATAWLVVGGEGLLSLWGEARGCG